MKTFLISLLTFAVSSSCFAFLPVSSITSMTLPVYGVYMTSDAACSKGFVATVPLSLVPQSVNFVAKPMIGAAGTLPSTIGCVVIVIQNNFSSAWTAGTYTGMSGSNSDNIAACNGGGTSTAQMICNNGVPTWPTAVTSDAALIGLALKTTNCTTHTTTDVVPLVLSTNSACTGNSTADAGIATCVGNVNNFALPTTASDPSNGTRITAPSSAGNLKFIVNPTNTFGATAAAACGNTAAPLFSFAAN